MADNTPSVSETPEAQSQEKKDHSRDGSASSIASTPEQEAEVSFAAQENPQTQKRKGGRKPIYATSEERKQRNRQAQAAFRERRTEYIKQLETTIKHHEENLQTLQHNHRAAADECLMLRYKNSLLERILLEKGIDVKAELQAKTGSPTIGPIRGTQPGSSAQPPMQRALLNRHHQARRSIGGLPQKGEGLPGLAQLQTDSLHRSPHSQPTPASHASSPSTTTRSPNFLPQGGMISPNFGPMAQQQQHLRQQQPQPRSQYPQLAAAPQRPPNQPTPNSLPSAAGVANAQAGSGMRGSVGGAPGSSSYYPSPFQSHMDQLDQEYDAQADMLDDDAEHPPSSGPYPSSFAQSQQQSQAPQSQPTQQPQQAQQGAPLSNNDPNQPFPSPAATMQSSGNGNTSQAGAVFGTMNHIFDPYDPILDADPFGLSASMHFPTQFSYESR